jgi:hypothetical protein
MGMELTQNTINIIGICAAVLGLVLGVMSVAVVFGSIAKRLIDL